MSDKLKEFLAFIKRYAEVPLISWQLTDIEGALAHRFSYLIWPSGYGKTMIAALIIAAHLILSKVRVRSFGGSGDEDQAGLLHQALQDIFAHPDLQGLVTETRNEIRLKHAPKSVHRTLATHVSTTWGLTPSILVVDELSEATPAMEKMFNALISSLRKKKDSRLLIITSPGLRGSFAHRLLEEVRDDDRWFVSERQEEETPWLDTDHADLYQRILPREITDAKHRGIWAVHEGSVLDHAVVGNVFVPDLPDGPGVREGGVDLALTRASAAISILRLTEGIVVVDLLAEFRPPRGGKIDLTEIEDEIHALAHRFNVAFHFDIWQGALMCQRLGKRGVRCVEFPFTQEKRKMLFSRLLDTITTGRLKCHPHAELKRQLLSLEAKRLPSGAWRIDHRGGNDDLVVAIGLALQALPPLDGYSGMLPMGVGTRACANLRDGDFVDCPTADWSRVRPGRAIPDW